MAKPWDDTMKRLIRANPQHFVTWILKGAIFKAALSIELKNWTRETDFLLDVMQNEQQMLMHMEFQSREDENMAQRLLEYNVLATREHGRPVLSCLIYLRKDSRIAESPLVWELPTRQKVLYFHFKVIKLWEITAEELMQTNLAGLLPLISLTKDGGRYEVINEITTRLATAKEYNLLEYARRFASLVFNSESDREWLSRRFAVYKDILEDSWVVQEERQEGKREGLYQALLAVVQARFPEIVDLTKKQIEGIENPEALQDLLVKISIAQNVQDAVQALFALDKTERKTDMAEHDEPAVSE
jgi:DNA-binding XRE family transcriptional regulator